MRPSRMAAIVSRWNAGRLDARFSCPNGLMDVLLSRRPRSIQHPHRRVRCVPGKMVRTASAIVTSAIVRNEVLRDADHMPVRRDTFWIFIAVQFIVYPLFEFKKC